MWDFFSPLLLKRSHRKTGIEVLLSKKKEMSTCNFWVIRIALRPILAPPSQRKIGLMTLKVSFYLVKTNQPQLEQGEIGESPLQGNFTLGVVWSVQGSSLPFSSSVPQGLQDVITDSEGVGGSQPCLPRPGCPHLQYKRRKPSLTLEFSEAHPAVLAFRKHLFQIPKA